MPRALALAARALPATAVLLRAGPGRVRGGNDRHVAAPLLALALATVATVAVSQLLESVERQRVSELNDLLEHWTVAEARAEIRAESGRRFDPRLVELFLGLDSKPAATAAAEPPVAVRS